MHWSDWDEVKCFEVSSTKCYFREFRNTLSRYFSTLFTYCLGGFAPYTGRGVPEHHIALWLISNSLTHTTGLVTLTKFGKLHDNAFSSPSHLHHHHAEIQRMQQGVQVTSWCHFVHTQCLQRPIYALMVMMMVMVMVTKRMAVMVEVGMMVVVITKLYKTGREMSIAWCWK